MTIIVRPADIEPGPGPLTAQPGDEAGLGLLVGSVDGPDLHSPAHETQQPVLTAHTVVLEVQVQRLIPTSDRKSCVISLSPRQRHALKRYCQNTRFVPLH